MWSEVFFLPATVWHYASVLGTLVTRQCNPLDKSRGLPICPVCYLVVC